MENFTDLIQLTGFFHVTWRMLVMWGIVLGLLYLAVFKEFEPLLHLSSTRIDPAATQNKPLPPTEP